MDDINPQNARILDWLASVHIFCIPSLIVDISGKPFSYSTLHSALEVLGAEIDLPYDVPGGMASFRKTLALSFLFKFWNAVSVDLDIPLEDQDGLSVSTMQTPDDVVGSIHRAASKGQRDNSVRTSLFYRSTESQCAHYEPGSIRSRNCWQARTSSLGPETRNG